MNTNRCVALRDSKTLMNLSKFGTTCALIVSIITSAKASDYWIQQIKDRGRIIILNTGDVLQVDPADTLYSMLWLPAQRVDVLQGDEPVYPYKIVDLDENETVSAKLANKFCVRRSATVGRAVQLTGRLTCCESLLSLR